jgi:hypothetical protein
MLIKQITYAAIFWMVTFSCKSAKKEGSRHNESDYDLLHPLVLKLPNALAEISGLAYYPKDSSVFAIVDEDGMLYKIYLRQNKPIQQWHFDKKHDYEDLVLHDSLFYVLISNGKSTFPGASKKDNEFESLYFSDSLQQIVLLCKRCEDDNKKTASAWGFNINTQAYTASVLSINLEEIQKESGNEKMKLKASATAVNPVTNELYILSSINHLLIVTDLKGRFRKLYDLDPSIYKQAEGIAFTPNGDMIISNESHETGLPNLLIIKKKQKGL